VGEQELREMVDFYYDSVGFKDFDREARKKYPPRDMVNDLVSAVMDGSLEARDRESKFYLYPDDFLVWLVKRNLPIDGFFKIVVMHCGSKIAMLSKKSSDERINILLQNIGIMQKQIEYLTKKMRKKTKPKPKDEDLNKPLSDIFDRKSKANKFETNDIKTVGDAMKTPKRLLLRMRGIGPKSVRELSLALGKIGRSLKK
jgi:hypothetical protein